MTTGAAAAHGRPHDDFVLPFNTVKSGMTGRIVRLGAVVDTILSRHDHPEPVSELLGQAVALTAMLGVSLKFDGALTVQASTNGPVGMFVVGYETPGRLRAYALFDADRVAATRAEGGSAATGLLGTGHLALTIDPGARMDRYQGVVALEHGGLAEAAHTYFRQSEQLPTFVRLAVARHRVSTETGWQWRAGGLIVQHVSPVGGKPPVEDEAGNILMGEDDDHWQRVAMLSSTVEDHELLDPTLSSERLLYRLFHEEGVRVSPPLPLEVFCRCSRDRVASFLKTFEGDDISNLRDADGNVTVTCEFCNTAYRFEPPGSGPVGAAGRK
ncbi:MAG: Hsp33 family molecular chaperone [Hyphomicrobiaceae bacterium]|nr:Hsp33 family molecular chaperone [Hyphomicrobiaceae bacterium]